MMKALLLLTCGLVISVFSYTPGCYYKNPSGICAAPPQPPSPPPERFSKETLELKAKLNEEWRALQKRQENNPRNGRVYSKLEYPLNELAANESIAQQEVSVWVGCHVPVEFWFNPRQSMEQVLEFRRYTIEQYKLTLQRCCDGKELRGNGAAFINGIFTYGALNKLASQDIVVSVSLKIPKSEPL